jgi:metal-responsive CopG/Arc/MetJ family transcriptional regulator
MNQTLSVRIPDNMRRELEDLSHTDHISVSDLVRTAIRNYISIRRFRQLRSMAIPFAEAQGFFTDEDVFQEEKR